jgi:FimV-like protein
LKHNFFIIQDFKVSFFLRHSLKKWLLLACMLWMPSIACAADLGNLSVHSALGEPLKAEIEIVNVGEDELKTLSVSVATEQDYDSVGLNKLASHDQITINITKDQQGKPTALITSQGPMNDPFLNVIFQIISHKGKVIREYAFLLDPPGVLAKEISSPEIVASQPLAQEDDMALQATDENNEITYEVVEGETLASIVKKFGHEAMMNRALLAFYRSNLDAFENQDIHQLKSGSKLLIPSLEDIQSINETQANQFVEEKTQNWEEYQAIIAKRAEMGGVESDEALEQSSDGLLTSEISAADKAGQKEVHQSQDVVKLTKPEVSSEAMSIRDRVNAMQDDIAAHENNILEANKKTEALESQLVDMQKLLIIKDQKIEALTNSKANSPSGEVSFDSIQSWIRQYLMLAILLLIVVLLIGLSIWKNKVKKSRQALFKSSYENSRTAQKLKSQKSMGQNNASDDATKIVAAADTDVQTEVGADAVSSKTLDLIKDIDFDLKDQPAVETEIDPNAPNNSELNLAAINLDFNPKSSPKRKVKFESTVDMNMQIDLAAAYVDMGDKRRARQLLNKVIKEGDAEHQLKAQEILNQIA